MSVTAAGRAFPASKVSDLFLSIVCRNSQRVQICLVSAAQLDTAAAAHLPETAERDDENIL